MYKPILTAIAALTIAASPITASAGGGLDASLASALPTASVASSTPNALPEAGRTGRLSIERLTTDGHPAQDGVTVAVHLLPDDANGEPLDLLTNAGWNRAAEMTTAEALSVPRQQIGTGQTVGGQIVFTDLPIGVLLVTMTYNDSGNEASAPFVVTVPTTNETRDDWVYDIVARPKASGPVWANLGGVVWYDQNRDGIRDAGEPVKPGVRVYVYTVGADGSRTLHGTTYTNNNGEWLMTGLRPGDTKVVRWNIDPLNGNGRWFEATVRMPDSQRSGARRYSDAHVDSLMADAVELIAFSTVFVDAGVISDSVPPTTPSPTPSPTEPPVTPPGGPDLPVTGAAIAGLIVGASMLLTSGALFIGGARRRRRSEVDAVG